MKRIFSALFVSLLISAVAHADDTSFRRVKMPDLKGRQVRAVLTFSDTRKAVEVQPAKGTSISIPYSQIDKCSYEYTQRHRVNEGTIAAAPIGIGVAVMLTKSKSHWLEIDYHDEERPHAFVLRMDKHEYLRILDAVKAHTGIEAEILGNAKKR